MEKLKNIHPGEILLEEFLKPLEISQYRLSKETNIPESRISKIVSGKRSITTDTAFRLSKFFGNSPRFWLNLQLDFDVEEIQNEIQSELDNIKRYNSVSAA